MTKLSVLFLLSLAAALAGCDTWPPGGPPNYRLGYSDGCWTGYAEAGRQTAFATKRNLYGADADYKRGWHEGYDVCFEEEVRTPWVGGPDRAL